MLRRIVLLAEAAGRGIPGGMDRVPRVERRHDAIGQAHRGVRVRILDDALRLAGVIERPGVAALQFRQVAGMLFAVVEIRNLDFCDEVHEFERMVPQVRRHRFPVTVEGLPQGILPVADDLRREVAEILGQRIGDEVLLHARIQGADIPAVDLVAGLGRLGVGHAEHRGRDAHPADDGLAVVSLLALDLPDGGVLVGQALQDVGRDVLFQRPLLVHHVETLHALHLSFLHLLHVGKGEEPVGVLAADGGIGIHPFPDDFHLARADPVRHRALHPRQVVHLRGAAVPVGAAGITDDHRVIPFPIPLLRNAQVPGGMERLAVVVDTVQGEIGLVLRPFPVVLVTAEGRHRHRRSAHEADVRVLPIQGQIVLLPRPHRVQRRFEARPAGVAALQDGGEFPGAEGLSPGGQRIRHGGHLGRHVQHPLQEVHFLPLQRDLVLAVEGPVAVLQVVFLGCGQVEQVAVGAVVVGDEEPLVGNHAGGAIEAQRHDGVGDRRPRGIRVVDFPRGESKSPLLHLLFKRLVQGVDHPHPFIGQSRHRHQGQGG